MIGCSSVHARKFHLSSKLPFCPLAELQCLKARTPSYAHSLWMSPKAYASICTCSVEMFLCSCSKLTSAANQLRMPRAAMKRCTAALWSENGCSRSTSSACKRNACTCRRVGCVWMGVIDRLRDKCNVKEAAALWSGNGCSRSISSA